MNFTQKNNPEIDIRNLENTVCTNCANIYWNNVFILKKVSALLTENGKPGYVPVQTWACSKCGNVNDELNPLKIIQ